MSTTTFLMTPTQTKGDTKDEHDRDQKRYTDLLQRLGLVTVS